MAAGEPVQSLAWSRRHVLQARCGLLNRYAIKQLFVSNTTCSPENLTESLPENMIFNRGLTGTNTPGAGVNRPENRHLLVAKENWIDGPNELDIRRRTGGIIWIDGEAGIGKSRLMREFSTGYININRAHPKWRMHCPAFGICIFAVFRFADAYFRYSASLHATSNQ